jgi:hypothetical protein
MAAPGQLSFDARQHGARIHAATVGSLTDHLPLLARNLQIADARCADAFEEVVAVHLHECS